MQPLANGSQPNANLCHESGQTATNAHTILLALLGLYCSACTARLEVPGLYYSACITPACTSASHTRAGIATATSAAGETRPCIPLICEFLNMLEFLQSLNWVVVGQIILIDILLGGDNAIVIALACRRLPERQRLQGILWGTAGAIMVRVLLITFAVTLLSVPWLKAIGGVLLIWIGVKLLTAEDEDHDHIDGGERLATAIKTIIVADLVMSIDNVVAVASAAEHAGAEHKLMLVVFGIMVSIPIVIWGSSLVLKIMDRVPALVTAGGALLGYLGGAMISSDLALKARLAGLVQSSTPLLPAGDTRLSLAGSAGALFVVLAGWWISQRRTNAPDADDKQA